MHGEFPGADTRHPLILPNGAVHRGTVFLKPVLDHPRIEVGEYSYASAHVAPDDWAAHLAPYLYPDAPDRLIIGKFCQFADGVTFITASANHRRDGFSTFPFAVFDGGFADDRPSLPQTPGADLIIGHDVWLGTGVRVLPGAKIGNGVIAGAGAVIAGDVPPYSLVVGNPARVVRRRFDEATIAMLQQIAWWDWPIAHILTHESEICGGDVDALEAAQPA